MIVSKQSDGGTVNSNIFKKGWLCDWLWQWHASPARTIEF